LEGSDEVMIEDPDEFIDRMRKRTSESANKKKIEEIPEKQESDNEYS